MTLATLGSPPLAYTPTPEFWALAVLIATALIKLATDWRARADARLEKEEEREAEIERWREEREYEMARREEDRKDLLAVASIAAADRVAVEENFLKYNQAGKERLKSLLESNTTTRLYAKKAIDTANKTNEKIASLGKAIAESKSDTQKVEVMNTTEHPVPVKEP